MTFGPDGFKTFLIATSTDPEPSPLASPAKSSRQFIQNATIGLNHWWRWAVGIAAIAALILVGQFVSRIAGDSFLCTNSVAGSPCRTGQPPSDGGSLAVYIVGGLLNPQNTLGLLGIWLVVTYVHKKNLRGLITGRHKFDIRRFSIGVIAEFTFALILGAIVIVVFQMDSIFLPGKWDSLGVGIVTAAMLAIILLVRSGFEQIFFQGYLLHGLIQVTRNRIQRKLILAILAGLIAGLIRAAILIGEFRMMSDGVNIFTPEGALALLYYLSLIVPMGIFFALVVLLDGGLELTWGISFANMLVGGVFWTLTEIRADNPSFFLLLVGYVPVMALLLLTLNVCFRWFKLPLK